MLLFDSFPTLAQAEAFASQVTNTTQQVATPCRNSKVLADNGGGFLFQVKYPTVLVQCEPNQVGDPALEALATQYGGKLAG